MPLNIADLLSNEVLRQREFPITKDQVFLAHAGDCPLPARVAGAVASYAQTCVGGDQEAFVYPGILDEGRQTASRFLGCSPDEVAFVGPTSLGLSLFASGIKFRRNENILIYFDDYPSNVYPWMALAGQGVEVRLMNTRGLGLIRPQDVLGQVDENTRLVALASCHFISGYRIDVEAIGHGLHQRNILFCLDAIQTLGAFPLPIQQVDFLAADAHKWLLGPCGAGLIYVRRAVQSQLNPPLYGWNNVQSPDFVSQENIQFKTGAQKYEAGTYNLFGLVGLLEGLKLLLEVGIDNIGRELLRKRAMLVPALQAKGYTVVLADAPESAQSGIVSFFKPGADMAPVQARLRQERIITSLRTDRKGQKYIRLSPHFYIPDDQLERTLALL